MYEDREIIGYEFIHLGKMMDMIKNGVNAQEAFEKNLRTIFDMMLDYLSGNTDNGKGTC